jgi:hypothetical protein
MRMKRQAQNDQEWQTRKITELGFALDAYREFPSPDTFQAVVEAVWWLRGLNVDLSWYVPDTVLAELILEGHL